MINRIDKDFRKLTKKELISFRKKWKKIISSEWSELDVQKMKGERNMFRVRIGDKRIIFLAHEDGSYELRRIKKRDENTYK